MVAKAIKPKKCKVCAEAFVPVRSLQFVCGPLCGLKYAEKLRMKVNRKEYKEAKVKMKSRADWLKEAQTIFNKFIRLRDDRLPCISCSRHHEGQYHAGHYKSVGAHGELRFHELNVHKQCAPCNNHLSGNIVNYRMGMINKIGIDKVEWIEGNHQPLKLSIDEIRDLIAKYKLRIRNLTREE